MNADRRHLNLIPPALRRRESRRRLVRVASTSTVLAALVTAALLGLEWARGVAAYQELLELDAKYAPFAEISKQQGELSTRLAELRAREQLSLRLSREDRGVAMLGAVALAAGRSDGAVYVESLRYGDDRDATQSLRLVGAGVDAAAIAGFAEELRRSGVFESVAVESTGALAGGAVNLRQFTVACRP